LLSTPVPQPSPPTQSTSRVHQPSPPAQSTSPVHQPSPPAQSTSPVHQPSPPAQSTWPDSPPGRTVHPKAACWPDGHLTTIARWSLIGNRSYRGPLVPTDHWFSP